MPLTRRTALAGSLLFGAGCSPLAVLDATVPDGGLRAERGISYGPLPRQRLDVWYAPARFTGPRPLVIWFYGGGWRAGERAGYRFVAAALAQHGIITVIPDYRIYPEAIWPAFMQDGAAAAAWAMQRIAALGADPQRVFLAGYSAGAHIALLLALDPRWLARAGADRATLAGAIGLSGPYDFLPLPDPFTAQIFADATDLRETQPISFADASAPPLLLLTGAIDTTVRPGNSERLAARINAAGGRARVVEYPGIGHIGAVTALTPLFRGRAPVLQDMLAFIAAERARPAA
jgi:acetyl esterase/lipase